jgi:hypothetical protein
MKFGGKISQTSVYTLIDFMIKGIVFPVKLCFSSLKIVCPSACNKYLPEILFTLKRLNLALIEEE